VIEGVLNHDSLTSLMQTAKVGDLGKLLAAIDTPEGKTSALAEVYKH